MSFEADPGLDPWRLQTRGQLDARARDRRALGRLVAPGVRRAPVRDRRHLHVHDREPPGPRSVSRPLHVVGARSRSISGCCGSAPTCSSGSTTSRRSAARAATASSTVRRVPRRDGTTTATVCSATRSGAGAFCWQMVRSIVGTLVEVGNGKRRPGDLLAVLRVPTARPRPSRRRPGSVPRVRRVLSLRARDRDRARRQSRLPFAVACWPYGEAGAAWLRDLPRIVEELEQRWDVTVGRMLGGGTAAYVAEATTPEGAAAVVKVAMPAAIDGVDAFDRSVVTYALSNGRGCAALLASDRERSALLLERLGRNLDELGFPVERQLEIICEVLARVWVRVPTDTRLPPVPRRRGGWPTSSRPRGSRSGDPARRERSTSRSAFAAEREAAFDPTSAVLVHGDVDSWNTLEAGRHVQAGRPGGARVGTGARPRGSDARAQRGAPGRRRGRARADGRNC